MKLINKFITYFCILILFLLIVLIILFHSGRNLINRENLSNYTENADILNMDSNVIFNLDESGITLKEKIYNLAVECNIPEKIILDILKSEEINIVLGDFFNKTIYYLVNGGYKPQLSDDTINKMIQISMISLDEHLNIMMEDDELEKYVLEYCHKLTNIIPDRQEMIGNLPISYIQKFLNFDIWTLYLLAFSCILLLNILTFSFYKPIKYLGICFFISGVIFVILGCMNNVINDIIVSQITNMKILISPLITILLTIWFKLGVLISFSGVFLILFYVIINRIIINSHKTR